MNPVSMRQTVTPGADIPALRSVQIGINVGYLPSFLAFLVFAFDPGLMAHDRRGPDPDRLLVARLDGIAKRHARWGGLTEDEKAAGAAELREVADGCGDLLAETAGLALGTAESKRDEFRVRGQATAAGRR